MKPDLNELDEEIRGHMALSIRERIERGEDPEAARLAALKEFGNVLLTRDSIRSVWRHRWLYGLKPSHGISGLPCAPSSALRA